MRDFFPGEAMITVHLEPDGETLTFERLNTALMLLNRLALLPTQALVIREGGLLTPDRKLHDGEVITVKKTTSVG
jgi:sulfur carrier protein